MSYFDDDELFYGRPLQHEMLRDSLLSEQKSPAQGYPEFELDLNEVDDDEDAPSVYCNSCDADLTYSGKVLDRQGNAYCNTSCRREAIE